MRKFFPILFLTLFLLGCTQNYPPTNSITKTSNKFNTILMNKLSISDIFPFKKNVQLKYSSNQGSNSNSSIYVDFIKNDRMQFRLVNSDTSTCYVIENKDGELRIITSRNSFCYHDDLTSIQNANPEIILKEPLVKGTSWILPNGNKRYISNDNVQIATTLGKYIAIEITTETDKGKILNYYAPNIGLIKTLNDFNNIVSSLNAIETDVISTESVNFYYPNPKKDSLVFFKRQLDFKTDDTVKTYFEKYFKEVPSKTLEPIISENTRIENLYLNIEEKEVYLDFSKEFIKEMNLGSTGEIQVLKCITNTLCTYFNVDKLLLTVEGNPYASGHIIMKPNEVMYADIKTIQEFK